MSLPRSLKEKAAWWYLAALQILFLVLFTMHNFLPPDREWIPVSATWPTPLLLIATTIALYFAWGWWTGVVVLLAELWCFRRISILDLWATMAISALVLSAEAGIYNTLIIFDVVTASIIVEVSFTYLFAFGVPAFAAMVLMNMYSFLKGRHSVPTHKGG